MIGYGEDMRLTPAHFRGSPLVWITGKGKLTWRSCGGRKHTIFVFWFGMVAKKNKDQKRDICTWGVLGRRPSVFKDSHSLESLDCARFLSPTRAHILTFFIFSTNIEGMSIFVLWIDLIWFYDLSHINNSLSYLQKEKCSFPFWKKKMFLI